MNRRKFLIGASAAVAGVAVPVAWAAWRPHYEEVPIPAVEPRSAAVFWYSQTGNTARYGRLIAAVQRARGLDVVADDYRRIDPAAIATRDIVVAGTPFQYFDVPSNLREWIEALPDLPNARVASYCTYGGPGGNTTNTAMRLLESLAERGGLPVAFDRFGNLSTFAPTWSLGNEARILAYRHLPNEETYARDRAFAGLALERTRAGTGIDAAKRPDPSDLLPGGGISRAGTRLLMGAHGIDAETCTGCGTCVDHCPAGAIDLAAGRVDSVACLACFGCVNNCPTGAIRMNFLDRPVEGLMAFAKRQGIAIAEPPELAGESG